MLITKNLSKHDKRGITGIVFLMYKCIKVANFHGYHLEHLWGLRKSRSERQKVANNYGS